MLSEAGAIKPELIRIASFSKWPHAEATMTTVSLVCLAAAGFSYTGHSDGIVCNYCDTVVRGWLGTQRRPHLEHRCPSKPATHDAADAAPARHTANVSTTGSYEVTAANCHRIESKPNKSGLSEVNCDHDEKLTEKMKIPWTHGIAALSQQMALVGVDDVDDVTQLNSRDVKDAAAANSSKPMHLSLTFNSQ